jgi:transposase
MQGKEAPEQDTSVKCTVGVDVCKAWLDVHVAPAGRSQRVANNTVGIRQLKRWLRRFNVQLVVIEATGKWHRPVRRSLHASGIPVAVVDPYRVRMFARAQGILAKTDRLDARVLAQFAAVMAPVARPPAPQAMEELSELVTARESAVAEQTMLKNQLAAAEGAFLRRQLRSRIARMSKDVAALEGEILSRIEADESLARRYAILVSIPGFGPIVAATLIARLAELGTCSAKQVGALAGLAPVADESGEHRGARVVRGGRPSVRNILYLAAVAAARFNPDMKAFYRRQRAEKQSAKLALVAVARKLAVLANTLVSQDRLWQPQPPKCA